MGSHFLFKENRLYTPQLCLEKGSFGLLGGGDHPAAAFLFDPLCDLIGRVICLGPRAA